MHLDLGIGGAEQLVVNIACMLKDSGHKVTIFTTHHDVNHCFEETKPDGKTLLYHILMIHTAVTNLADFTVGNLFCR